MFRAYTVDPIVSPVKNDELADWVRGDCDDPILPSLLIQATSLVISFLKLELINRNWVVVYQNWPICGAKPSVSLSKSLTTYQTLIELPNTNLSSIDMVVAGGELLTTDDYTVVESVPMSLQFNSVYSATEEYPALSVSYVAGYGENSAFVPDEIKQGILTTAGYIYLNRGCKASDAIVNSGADALLQPFRAKGGVVL